MTHTQQIIQDAIDGGFSYEELLRELGIRDTYTVSIGRKHMMVRTHQGNTKKLCDFAYLFLKPTFWQAVGKTRGWIPKELIGKRLWWFECVMQGDDYETALSKIV